MAPAESSSDESTPEDYVCSLTLQRMKEQTMLTASGNTYEASALRDALARRPGVDPLTNAAFEGPPVLASGRADTLKEVN
mmetsp:Transcript_29277/g.90569  ORF Transcript_29277/g.90569 Transcript_29277/m.90569 type:complete len:80 (+) Transcript_29277:344-583(+)